MTSHEKKRKFLSDERKVKVILETDKGKKKADVCREFDPVNSTIQNICKKAEPKLLVHQNRTNRE